MSRMYTLEQYILAAEMGKVEEALTKVSPVKSKLRSTEEAGLHLKGKCLFCFEKIRDLGEYRKMQAKLPKKYRKPVYSVTVQTYRDTVLRAANERNDEWGKSVMKRIQTVFDLVAADAMYHKPCEKSFILACTESSSEHMSLKSGHPAVEDVKNAMETISNFKETSDEWQFSLKELVEEIEGYSEKWIKRKLTEKYGNDILFCISHNKKKGTVVICFRQNAGDELVTSWYKNILADANEDQNDSDSDDGLTDLSNVQHKKTFKISNIITISCNYNVLKLGNQTKTMEKEKQWPAGVRKVIDSILINDFLKFIFVLNIILVWCVFVLLYNCCATIVKAEFTVHLNNVSTILRKYGKMFDIVVCFTVILMGSDGLFQYGSVLVFTLFFTNTTAFTNSSYCEATLLQKSNFMVIASQILRPRSRFGIAVHVFENSISFSINPRSFRFYATISANGSDLQSLEQKLFWNNPAMTYFITPSTIVPNSFELHVLAIDDKSETVIFDKRSQLMYDDTFVSVTFQTTRPIYCAGQTVRFRILVLETTLLPFNDVLDVFVLDPDGFVMKRWLSAYTNNGVVSLKFKLPKLAKNGMWKIRSKINNQVNEKSIMVETYYQPLFEVIVSSPPYIADTEEVITAKVYGLYPSQKHVRGNATVKWLARTVSKSSNFSLIRTDILFVKERKHEIVLRVVNIVPLFKNFSEVEVKIMVQMMEYLSGEIVSGFSHTRIITNEISIMFLAETPLYFIPGTTFYGHVAVSYKDNEPIPSEILSKWEFKVQMTCDVIIQNNNFVSEIIISESGNNADFRETEFFNMLVNNNVRQRFLNTGVLPFHFDVPKGTSHIRLKAVLSKNGETIEKEIEIKKKYSTNNEFIKLWSTSDDVMVGDYAVFHISSNFTFEVFYILILSKGMVLRIREERVTISTSLVFTFSEPVSSDMAPWFHLLVYSISKSKEIHSDVVTVPVNGFARYKTTLTVNTGKDFRNEHIELVFSGGEGAFIGMQAVRSMVYYLQGDHEITRSKVANSFLRFEKNVKVISRVEWFSRTGEKAKESVYFLSHGYTSDAFSVFRLNRLSVLSNLNISTHPEHRGCNRNEPILHCSTSNCSLQSELCDTIFPCVNETCSTDKEIRENYFLKRINWNSFIFDVEDGDWAFREIRKNDHIGDEFEIVPAPRTADDWYVSAFNMDMTYGFSMIEEPVVFSSKRSLMGHVLGPHQCHRGEQLGLKLYIHNFDVNQMLVIVKLLGSDDYKFVEVDEYGSVASYNARLLSGDHEILIYMTPESEEEIRFPVKPVIEQGPVEIQFYIASQAGRQLLSHTVYVMDVEESTYCVYKIETSTGDGQFTHMTKDITSTIKDRPKQLDGEGAPVNYHTSVTLDLKNRGLVLQYLDIIVEQTPNVPYEHYRRYVYGSPSANLAITNTVIGPVINEGLLNMGMLLKRESKGAMDLLFELHSNIWILHYLRYTNQLNVVILKETLYECNTLYAEIMRYYCKDGSFSHWETSDNHPSVWLTAWAVRVFTDATYPDWEFQFWIDPSVFVGMFRWLLTRQNSDGSFGEIKHIHPFDASFPTNKTTNKLTTLTTHVLISLHLAAQVINNELKSKVVIACSKARVFLERQLPTVQDPHLIAMITYAFAITGSAAHGFAFTKLQRHMRMNEDGLNYWARKSVPENSKNIENQKPYIRPRSYSEADSSAVEATSWALLAHLAHDGVTTLVENIVQWLVTMKMTNCGFTSIIDTAVAYRALTEFAFRSRILDITHINVKIETVSSEVFTYRVRVDNKSVNALQFKFPNVWGNININAKGSGIAFVQLDVDYGVDDERFKNMPLVDSFDLRIFEFYSHYRNKSAIIIESCLRYTGTANISGAAILEIQTPTGYHIRESDALKVVESGIHPNLKDARTVEGKTYWFFDFVDQNLYCFNHTIKRWYPVGNMTMYRTALLYEITARERFVQVLINSTSLYILSICEVCGSFQCPYCPYYNSTVKSVSTTYIVLLIILFVTLYRMI